MRVLISAYACEPDRGSEPGAGWAWAMAAAERHEVCLVTSDRHAEPVRAALAAHRPAGLVDVHFLEEEVGPVDDWSVPGRDHVRYWRWQRAAKGLFRRLHAEHRFDLGHHLTWAVDWQPSGLTAVADLPLVWGPVGGATPTSLRLARWLGPRGLAADLAREAVTRPARRLVGDRVARRAALVLAQNDDVAARLAAAGPVEVAPNVALDLPLTRSGRASVSSGTPARVQNGRRRAVFAGRVVAWKGIHLAVAALAHAPDWDLTVYGAGPDLDRARRRAERLGVADRVTFSGRLPRDEVLAAMADADAFLFPSIHDSAPWAVGEALSLGVPVVCLDRGGPPVLVRATGGGVVVPDRGDLPAALAAALDRLPPPAPSDHWGSGRLPDEIDRHYRRAVADAR